MKSPGFAVAAILAFGLGIGANTAIFSVVHALLLKPLAYRESERIVVLQHPVASPASPADFLDWRRMSRTMDDMASAQVWSPTLRTSEGVDVIPAMVTSANMFELLGVKPALGHAYTQADEKAANQPVVLSYSFWQRRFGSDSAVIGRKLVLDDQAYVVAAVMPPDFRFAPFWATGPQLWAIHQFGPRATDRGGRSLRIFARLRPGETVATAQAEMNVITAQLARQYPDTNANMPVQVVTLVERTVGNIRPTLLVLMGTVAFVLLIACANTGNLMIARATARKKEIAIRLALGATRARLLQAFLTESVVVSVLGGVAGAVFASWCVTTLSASIPAGALPRQGEIQLDFTAFRYCSVLSLATGLVAGLLPAWQAARGNLHDALKAGGRGSTAARHRTRAALVTVEVALSVALLAGAGLLMRSFVAIQSIDPGFKSDGIVTMTLSTSAVNDGQPGRRVDLYKRILADVRRLPGVQGASIVNHVPIAGDEWGTRFVIEGREAPRPGQFPTATWRVAMPGYFKTIGIRHIAGRDFEETDTESSTAVAIVNEALVRRYFSGDNPIGKRINLGESHTIVGVVADVKQQSLTSEVKPEVYQVLPQSKHYAHAPQRHYGVVTLVARASSDATSHVPSLKSAIWSASPGLPISGVATLDKVLEDVLWRERVTLALFTSFAALALILSATGIYAVIANLVAERTQEIGIRMALGADGKRILSETYRRSLPSVLIGAASGLVVALGLSGYLETLLYQVKPRDPAVLTVSVSLMIGVGALAVLIPSLRAARLDPLVALRED